MSMLKGLVATLVVCFNLFVAVTAPEAVEMRIRCASTTSTQNSALFNYILPIFEKKPA